VPAAVMELAARSLKRRDRRRVDDPAQNVA
jgi:hypothetical protein